jgi:hypothetical protein
MAAPGNADNDLRKQRFYREVNMRIREVAGTFSGDGPVEFICECGRRDCRATIALTEAEWDFLVSEGVSVLVTVEHKAAADGRRVITENAHFVLAAPV